MAEDNAGWQVCVDQTLHRQPPEQPLYGPCAPQAPLPPPPPTQGRFSEIPIVAICEHCVSVFCEFRMRRGALSLSLSTHRAQLFTDWLCESWRGFPERRKTRGGTGSQWTDRGSLVHKTSQNVNKSFLKDDLLIVPPTECQLWLRCLVWEKNEEGRDTIGRKQRG